MKGLWALVKRDLLLSVRQGGGIGTALGFFLTVIVLLPLAIGSNPALLKSVAPGFLWICLLLSVLLSSDRIFMMDYEDGSLELLTMGPAPLELLVLAKSLAHWLASGLPLAIAAPALGFLLNLDSALAPALGLAMVIGSLALSLLASLGAAITTGLRRGGLLISLLVLPLYVPVMVFGVSASAPGTATPDIAFPSLLILTAISLVAIVVTPLAGAASLRAHLR